MHVAGEVGVIQRWQTEEKHWIHSWYQRDCRQSERNRVAASSGWGMHKKGGRKRTHGRSTRRIKRGGAPVKNNCDCYILSSHPCTCVCAHTCVLTCGFHRQPVARCVHAKSPRRTFALLRVCPCPQGYSTHLRTGSKANTESVITSPVITITRCPHDSIKALLHIKDH